MRRFMIVESEFGPITMSEPPKRVGPGANCFSTISTTRSGPRSTTTQPKHERIGHSGTTLVSTGPLVRPGPESMRTKG